MLWEQGVGSSNLSTPTLKVKRLHSFEMYPLFSFAQYLHKNGRQNYSSLLLVKTTCFPSLSLTSKSISKGIPFSQWIFVHGIL